MATDHLPTLRGSLELARHNLLASLDPTRDHLPYWNAAIAPDLSAAFRHWWHGHNLGRWWDAMMRIDEAIGVRIPAAVERAMRRHVDRFCDNEDHLCLEPLKPTDRLLYDVDLHSLREGLLAQSALVRMRGDRRARAKGEAMVLSLDRLIADPRRWDLSRFKLARLAKLRVHWLGDATSTHGRLIEALVWFFQTTGFAPAMSLAARLVDYHAHESVFPDGRFNPASGAAHSHSYLGTLRGICLYGLVARRCDLVYLAARSMRVFVPTLVKESGFTPHDLPRDRGGETTSPGDAAQLAMWLADAGYSEFWDDAQRLVYARLLASQLVEPPGLTPAAGVTGDAVRDIDRRVVGAYGGCHDTPHGGHQPTTDVTAAGAHTIADVYRHAVVDSPDELRVNMQLDHESAAAKVTVRDTTMHGGSRTVTVIATGKPRPVWLRVPRWAGAGGARVAVGDRAITPTFAGDYVIVGPESAHLPITLTHDLNERRRLEPTDGVEYTLTWRGDRVSSIDPTPARLSFYFPWAHRRLDRFECSPLHPAKRVTMIRSVPRGLGFAPVTAVRGQDRFVDLRAFHGGKDGVLFVKAEYRAASAGVGCVRFGADGPVRMWVNGRCIATAANACNPAVAEGYVAPVTWRRGINSILLALATNHGRAWGIFLAPSPWPV